MTTILPIIHLLKTSEIESTDDIITKQYLFRWENSPQRIYDLFVLEAPITKELLSDNNWSEEDFILRAAQEIIEKQEYDNPH